MRELKAWVPTCGWGIPGTSAEPAATILTTPAHHPSACPVCGENDCLEDAGTVKAAKLLDDDFDYNLDVDVFDRAERIADPPEYGFADGAVVIDGEEHDVDGIDLTVDSDLEAAHDDVRTPFDDPDFDPDQTFEASFSIDLDDADDDVLDFFRMAFGLPIPERDQDGDADA